MTHVTRKESLKFPRPQFSHLKIKRKMVVDQNSYAAYLTEMFEIIYMWKYLAKHYSNIQYYLDENGHWERRICEDNCRWRWVSNSSNTTGKENVLNSSINARRVILSQWVTQFDLFYHDSLKYKMFSKVKKKKFKIIWKLPMESCYGTWAKI